MEMSPELGAAIVSLIVAIAGWFKNHSEVSTINEDRSSTKAARDADSQQMHDEIIRLKCKNEEQEKNIKVLFEQCLKNSKEITEFRNQLTEVICTTKNILETLKEIKDNRNGHSN